MVSFDYTIKDELGIHVRPAGQLAKLCSGKDCVAKMSIDGKEAELKMLFSVMALAVKCGDTVTITVEGADEEDFASEIKDFLEENL